MKSIAIITDSIYKGNKKSLLGATIKQNIEEVFQNHVIIHHYYIDSLVENVLIDEDIVLTMASNRATKIRNHVKNPGNIIVAERTFLQDNIYPLFSIPANSYALVVNDDIETTLEVVSSLYKIGITHLNLVPYEEGKDYTHLCVAITPSEKESVPVYIEHVIDIGIRVLDISTMLLILNKLNLNEKNINQNMYLYFEKIISKDIFMKENYNNLITRTKEINCLLDLSNDGILLTSEDGKILIYNKVFKELFNIHDNIQGTSIQEVIKDMDFSKYLSLRQEEDLIIYKNKHINVHKVAILHVNKKSELYFSFQEVTYVKRLEQNLNQKLKYTGQIAKYTFNDILTRSSNMEGIIQMGKKIAPTDLTILITGDSGTGKEVLAQAIHNHSKRSKQPFIALNCAAMPESLLESELFGYVHGSFTGASKNGKKGLFEQAHNGTIFLDEIGDMPLHLQTKLLRVLQERQIMPIGSQSIIDIDVRVIAATHRSLIDMVEEGIFRKDLFYRINVFPIHIPPLREREKDVLLLLKEFIHRVMSFSQECEELLTAYKWPGNIRELMNVASYINIIEDGSTVTLKDLPHYLITPKTLSHGNPLDYFHGDMEIIKEKADVEIVLFVLETIHFLNGIKKTSGRKHIIATLNEKALYIGENKIRSTLEILKDLKLVVSKTGRIGHVITEKGELFLKNYIKTIKTG